MALAALWKMSTYLQMTVKVNKCFSFFWSCDLRGEVEERGDGGGGVCSMKMLLNKNKFEGERARS